MKRFVSVLIIASCLPLSGCFRFYVSAREYKPILPIPEAPVLTEDAPFDNADFQAMVDYSMRLEVVIDSYNKLAHKNNIENGFEEE